MKSIFILLSLVISLNASSYASWLKKLENKELKYGYYESPTQLILVDKNGKNLRLINYEKGVLNQSFQTAVIVGKSGDKLAEGDLKTPIGAYELTRRFVPRDRYLGPLAFSLAYPNLLDRAAKRTGSGIWIHGYPMDGVREDELKTKGCVALENDILMEFDKLVTHQKSIALIYENDEPNADQEQIALVLSQMDSWKKAWQDSDLSGYLKFYDENFTRYDGMSFSNFKAMKSAIFSRKGQKSIKFSNFSVTPYPNLKNETIFRVSFFEKYLSDSHKFEGKKTLYLRLSGDKIKILVEE